MTYLSINSNELNIINYLPNSITYLILGINNLPDSILYLALGEKFNHLLNDLPNSIIFIEFYNSKYDK